MTTNKTEVKRYDCTSGGSQHCYGCYTMEETELGDYVEWEAHEALQADLADMERDYLVIIEAQDAEHRKQLARLQAENAQLRAALRRLCNIHVVDDYYDGQLREDRLDEAVNRAINAAMDTPK